MTVHSPIPDFAAAREAMVESQLRPQGVTDPGVLDAMGRIERERFLPSHTRPLAYVDRAVAIGDGRFLPAPAVLGQLLTQMKPRARPARARGRRRHRLFGRGPAGIGLEVDRARELGRARRGRTRAGCRKWSRVRSKPGYRTARRTTRS